ncbi:MAG: sensor histidine kinase [Alphaproteobacteria bacterium]
MRSLRARLLLGAALWIGLALLVTWLAISALLRGTVERAFEARLDATLVSLLATIEADDEGLDLARPLPDPEYGRVGSGWYWQVLDAGKVHLRSRSLLAGDLAPGALPAPGERAVADLAGPHGAPIRALMRTLTVPGAAAPVTLLVAGPRREIDVETERVDRTLAIALAILGAGLTAAVLIQTTLGLAPLRRIRLQLAAVRDGRRQRLDETAVTEIRPLAHEVNALLDHNAAVLERARAHASNLAHALKTPLSALAVTAERAGDHEVADAVGRMERMIRHHLRRARAAAAHGVLGVRTDVASVVADLRLALARIHADRAIAITMAVADGAVFAGERQDLEEMVGNLLDNACKWARGVAALTASVVDGRLSILVEDDGAGLAPDEIERALAIGSRLDRAVAGDGFGLPIVRDLAGLYGGSLALGHASLGGLAARLDLPAIEPG